MGFWMFIIVKYGPVEFLKLPKFGKKLLEF